VQRDTQPVAPDTNLVHPLDGVGRHRHTIDFCAQCAPAILDLAAVSVEMQYGMTGSYFDILQTDHYAGIAPDGHLS
jgi:hypothetical protein